MKNNIYKLKLHEEIELGNDSYVMRVPNGFLYTDIWFRERKVENPNDPFGFDSEREEFFVTRTFVPWDHAITDDDDEIPNFREYV